MSHYSVNNIGSRIDYVGSHVPAIVSAGTRNGASIDRMKFGSCVLVHQCGAVTGAPTAIVIDVKLQDSDDGVAFDDVVGYALPTKSTSSAESRQLDLNLSKARRYVRVVEVVAFTGGTTPAAPSSCSLILGGSYLGPI